MIPVVGALLKQGLALVGNAVLAKGKEYIEQKTGVNLSKPELSSEDYVILRQYEMEHEEELIRLRQQDDKLQVEIDAMFLKDVDSARQMQVAALSQDDVWSKRFIYIFALMWSAAAMTYIGFITFSTIPEANTRFADTILGFVLGTILGQIMAFFFGSSRSSQSKDGVLQSIIAKRG